MMARTTFAVLLLSACTGEIGGDDPTTTDPPPDTVAVVVRDGTLPVANVAVIFQAADDTVIAEATTDRDGRASAVMPAGGNVTVIRTYPMAIPPEEQRPVELYTYVGVAAGEELVVAGELDMAAGTPSAINVKVPETAAGTVTIVTPCGSGQGTAPTIPITVLNCPLEVPFYVTDGNDQSFLMRAQVSENVDLSLGVLSDRLGATLSATNVPPDIASINVEKRIQADAYQLYSSGTKRVDQTPATVNLPDLQGADAVVVAALARTTGGTQLVATREPYAAEPTIIDAGALARIPYTTKVTYAPTGVSWTEDGTGTVDFVIARLDVQRPDPTGGPYDVHFVRTVVAPYAGPNLRLPQLPDATYNPTADDSIGGRFGLVAVTGGYEAARASVFAYPAISDIAPMNGSVTISYTGTAP